MLELHFWWEGKFWSCSILQGNSCSTRSLSCFFFLFGPILKLFGTWDDARGCEMHHLLSSPSIPYSLSCILLNIRRGKNSLVSASLLLPASLIFLPKSLSLLELDISLLLPLFLPLLCLLCELADYMYFYYCSWFFAVSRNPWIQITTTAPTN